MSLTLRTSGITGLALLCGMVLLGSQPAAALYSDATIDNQLSNGIQTAVNWDTDCKDYLSASYRGARFQSNGQGTLREGINDGASYKSDTWLSKRNSGNTVTPIYVSSTDTSVPLQINNVMFLCGPLVNKDIAGITLSTCKTNVTGQNIIDSASRWVVNSKDANDVRPNSQSSGCMYPSKTFYITKIKSLSVIKDNSQYYSGTTSGGVNTTMNTSRDDNSRYWFGNTIPISFKPSGGFNRDGYVHLRMGYKKYSAYHSTDYQASTKSCEGPGGLQGVVSTRLTSDQFVERCDMRYDDLFVQIRLKQNFTLVPSLSVSPPLLTPDNTDVTVTSSVKNTGTSGTGRSVNWQVTRFVLAPGRSYAANSGDNAPCDQYRNYAAGSCQSVKTGSQSFPINTTNIPAFGNNPGFLAYGSRVCYFLSVKPYDDSIDKWAHSAPDCSIVGKQPTISVQGNDLRVGSALALSGNLTSKVQGTTLVKGGNAFGSWAEYGIIAPGAVANMGSGSAFALAGGGPTAQPQWSKLTFANDTTYGNYTTKDNVGTLPDMATYFQGNPMTKNVGDITLNSYEANTVYISSGVVTINTNINAQNGTVPTIGALNQMIIIAAGGIRISQGVTNIDAWLITPKGTLDTCWERSGAPLAANICDKQLTINGPVQAKTLMLRRTFGDEKNPAESINLRGDAYLWARRQSEQTGTYQTTQITDLPPRY